MGGSRDFFLLRIVREAGQRQRTYPKKDGDEVTPFRIHSHEIREQEKQCPLPEARKDNFLVKVISDVRRYKKKAHDKPPKVIQRPVLPENNLPDIGRIKPKRYENKEKLQGVRAMPLIAKAIEQEEKRHCHKCVYDIKNSLWH